MAPIYPISSSRVSDALLRSRLMSQFDFDRAELLRLQDQLSTGMRIAKPSDDAPAATRAIGLQRLIEQNELVQRNLNTSQSFVAAGDNALSGVASLLTNIRGQALGAVDSTASPAQREIVIQEIQTTMKELLDAGNHKFRGRYLFAGSQTTQQPFQRVGSLVSYAGNQQSLPSLVDTDFLAATNVHGDQVFGAISAAVKGTADLNPVLTEKTRLSELRGGSGVQKGSFIISDGRLTSTIDISRAETVGDVMRLIESQPPAGRSIVVRLSGNGLVIQLNDGSDGNLTIRDAPSGRTALELGILSEAGTGTAPLIGTDLNPRLRLGTAVDDLLGSRASALLSSGGDFNDILITAAENGSAWNGVEVVFTTLSGTGNQAVAQYDATAHRLEIAVSPGSTSAAEVVEAINATSQFRAQLDNKLDPQNNGSGLIDPTATASTAGGAGEVLDLSSGLQIVNGGRTYEISFANARTVQDLLNTLNGSGAGVLARINDAGTGIDIQSRISGADFQIGENGGRTAEQLGVRTLHRGTRLADLNFGQGVETATGADLIIQRKDGVELQIDLSGANTVGDVIDRINQHAGNTGNAVTAQLVSVGNGLQLVDDNPAGGELTVRRGSSFAAWGLGLVPRGETQVSGSTVTGRDVNPQETKGVFNTLLRLQQSVEANDVVAVERALVMLDDDFRRLNFARAELGARGRAFEAIGRRTEDEEVELRASLSDEIDADMVKSISDLTARQASLQATLRLVGDLMRTSVLDFL